MTCIFVSHATSPVTKINMSTTQCLTRVVLIRILHNMCRIKLMTSSSFLGCKTIPCVKQKTCISYLLHSYFFEFSSLGYGRIWYCGKTKNILQLLALDTKMVIETKRNFLFSIESLQWNFACTRKAVSWNYKKKTIQIQK